MYATINEFLFPVFLFVSYFCAFSIMIYQPKNRSIVKSEFFETSSQSNLNNDIGDSSLAEKLIAESEKVPFIVENEVISFNPAIPDSEQEDCLYIQTETIINNLNKRQSRKLCQPLGIQQKCGQAEKSLTFIKTEIRDLFTSHPEKVIGVIREKLPELIGVSPQASEITEAIAS